MQSSHPFSHRFHSKARDRRRSLQSSTAIFHHSQLRRPGGPSIVGDGSAFWHVVDEHGAAEHHTPTTTQGANHHDVC